MDPCNRPNREHSHTVNNAQDSSCTSLIESIYSEDHHKIPIWLSVFFGNPIPANPRLDHALFTAQLPEQLFRPFDNASNSPFTKDYRPLALSCLWYSRLRTSF
ncbi:hypothetical protein BJX96DRAFT_145914 [Aspergillus floccosus]